MKKVYIETYGCQMNVADSEMVATILKDRNFIITRNIQDADIVLLNTCSIRENAEQKIYKRLEQIKQQHGKQKPDIVVGLIGCMSERVDVQSLIDKKLIHFAAGPDSYQRIGNIIEQAKTERVIDIVLSHTENYEDIIPEQILYPSISVFVPIMRGCENYCAYCVVPFTRGKERSRSMTSILAEVEHHCNRGAKEIILLGQNVNSYRYVDSEHTISFASLLSTLARQFPHTRFRFATSHPKDLSDELLYTIAEHENICRSIHLPMQSGSDRILQLMNRNYTRDWYLKRVEAIYNIIPDCTISTDIIAGFCTETEKDHQLTLSAMQHAGFFHAYMFKYSERPGTLAARKYKDDVPEEVKIRRLNEIIQLQQHLSLQSNQGDIGKIFDVLVEGPSKRNRAELMGRTSQNKVVVFKAQAKHYPPGSYARVHIVNCTSATLKGKLLNNQNI